MIVGAVLTGGRSTRMGRDKAFVEIEGVPMATRVADALRSGGCHEVVAVGGDLQRLAALGLATTPDRWPGEGPVGGVLSALSSAPEGDAVVVVACDTPWLDGATIASLIDALRAQPAALVAMGRTDRPEPLCAAWRPTAAAALRTAFHDGERRLHRVLASLDADGLLVAVPVDANVLRNVNAPNDVPG